MSGDTLRAVCGDPAALKSVAMIVELARARRLLGVTPTLIDAEQAFDPAWAAAPPEPQRVHIRSRVEFS